MANVSRMALSRIALAVGLALPALVAQGQAAQPAAPAAVRPARVAAAPASIANQGMPAGPCGRLDIAPVVQIPVGKSTVIKPAMPIARILLGNPENARAARPSETPEGKKDEGVKAPAVYTRPGVADVDVLLLGPNEVYLLGKTIGSTNVVMIDRSGACTAFDVVVDMDASPLQLMIGRLLPDEKDVKVEAAFDSVVLRGMVTDTEALARITDLAQSYLRRSESGSGNTNNSNNTNNSVGKNPRIVNLLEVGAPQQVMLEVKVAEISKNLLDQFGIDFSRGYATGNGSMLGFLSGIFGGTAGIAGQISGVAGATVGGGAAGAIGNEIAAGVWSGAMPPAAGTNTTQIKLNMQKTDGLIKVLAEPSIMAISGQTGSFLAGGKIFIPVSTAGTNGGDRYVTLEEKEFGVSVNFTPTVLGNGRINLRVRPEVSELNQAGVTITGINGSAVLPSFTSRRAETTVQLMDGQSFAIGGLIKNNTATNVKAFPFLGEIPILGALFRSTEFQTDRSELVFVITTRLVKPLPTAYRLPTDHYLPPTRTELILNGQVEGRPPAAPVAPVAPPADQPAAPPPGGGFDTQSKEVPK
jgi:pilus assembly protein CpaC